MKINVFLLSLFLVSVLFIASCTSSYQQTTPSAPSNNQPAPTYNQPSQQPPAPSNPPAVTASSSSIDISNYAFVPTPLTINVGDTVTWTNKDSAPHTVTSDSGSELSSGSLSNGQTYTHTFTTAGTYNYHCSVHSMMKGEIIVK